MKIVVTGSSGHLGEALMRTLRETGHEAIGIDILPSPFTAFVGSICDRAFVRNSLRKADAVLHTATLHKPHVATHAKQRFVDTNVTGTLNLLEEAVAAGVGCFVFTSTTSAFGAALTPPRGEAAAWITEDVKPVPKNIYGVTKIAAEDVCELVHREHGIPCLVLRTSRFFPEQDDDSGTRRAFDDLNVKVNELLYRRVDLEDVVAAHLLALERAGSIRFGKYIVSATTPFSRGDTLALREDAAAVVKRLIPGYEQVYAHRGWSMFPRLDRVYVNDRARQDLGWQPKYDFRFALDMLRTGQSPSSRVSRSVGSKGYHRDEIGGRPYPAE